MRADAVRSKDREATESALIPERAIVVFTPDFVECWLPNIGFRMAAIQCFKEPTTNHTQECF